MSQILMLVNRSLELHGGQTTAHLAAALVARGHRVFISDVSLLDMHPHGFIQAMARGANSDDPVVLCEELRHSELSPVALDGLDCVWVRTNPGRDLRAGLHDVALQLLMLYEADGGLVVNAPFGLVKASSKAYISCFPTWSRPETLISNQLSCIRAFLESIDGRAVLKPVQGSQGRDVYVVNGPQDPNLSALVTSLSRYGRLMVQSYVAEAPEGDIRILLLGGEPIVKDGKVAAVRRRPAAGEFRSNVHLGGQPEFAQLSQKQMELIRAVGPQLRADGLFLVGLDVVGDLIVECNAFSPGGLQDASTLAGADFMPCVLDQVEALIHNHRMP